MGIVDFIDLSNAQYRAEEESWDREYQRTAWYTALLMNATGNYKKPVKAEALYKSPFENNDTVGSSKKVDNQYVVDEQEKLKRIFGL